MNLNIINYDLLKNNRNDKLEFVLILLSIIFLLMISTLLRPYLTIIPNDLPTSIYLSTIIVSYIIFVLLPIGVYIERVIERKGSMHIWEYIFIPIQIMTLIYLKFNYFLIKNIDLMANYINKSIPHLKPKKLLNFLNKEVEDKTKRKSIIINKLNEKLKENEN